MATITCSINNCSNNDLNVCYASKVSINGKRSHTSSHTNCSSFIDNGNGSFSNNASNSSACNFVSCNVKTCANQAGTVCSLNNISVNAFSDKPNTTSQTHCSSFKCR